MGFSSRTGTRPSQQCYPLCQQLLGVAADTEQLSAGSGPRPSDCAGAAAVTAVLLCIPCATLSFLCITTDIYAGSHAFCVRTRLQLQMQLQLHQWPACPILEFKVCTPMLPRCPQTSEARLAPEACPVACNAWSLFAARA